MELTSKLKGLTVFVTGASRGVGRAIAVKAAKDGANVVIAATTTTPHPVLPGTIYTTLKEVEDAGGKGLACVMDIKEEKQVQAAVKAAIEKFGGIDIVVNNASSVHFSSTEALAMETYDEMNSTNARGTFLVSKLCLPYLKKSSHAHILNISPPLKVSKKYIEKFGAYATSKLGMTMCAVRMHNEFRPYNISVNTLWPKGVLSTIPVVLELGEEVAEHCKKPEIVADAAYAILTKQPKPSGESFIDEDVLFNAGVTDLDQYLANPKYKNEQYHCYCEDDPNSAHAPGPFNLLAGNIVFGKK